MKVITVAVLILAFLSVSLCLAETSPVEEAYTIYYQGNVDKAIELLEDYVDGNPDAGAYYFLGYAYYEKKQMNKAMEYFTKSFKLRSFYSPMEPKK